LTEQKAVRVVDVIDYQPRYKDYFRDINYEWLERYFHIEPYDRVILSDPEKHILSHGGLVLFGRLDGEVVGTCALLKHTEVKYELAKLGVIESARGQRVGSGLIEAAIDRARGMGAERLVLATSVRLKVANKLYEKYGFRRVAFGEIGPLPYSRETIVMALDLVPDPL